MKKVISIVGIILGAVVIVCNVASMIIGAILRMQISNSASIGIIGGVDGPTSILIAGRIGSGSVISELLIGVLLVGAGIWGYRKSRNVSQ